jgi:hypothetical protein
MSLYIRCWMTLAMLSLSVAAEPVRPLPAPPGQILDLRANAAGDLYVRTATNVLWLSLQYPAEGWQPVPLEQVVDLTENAARDVFVRQDLKTRLAFQRLSGAKAIPVTTTPNVPCERWYVDARGRAWLQNRGKLLVVGKEETLLDLPTQRQGVNYPQPCEWQPGYVALICGQAAIWATPDNVTVDPAPPFVGDAMGLGPFRLGTDHLLAGCDRRSSRVNSGILDPRKPAEPPQRLNLGWDWFYGMVTAPDGRLLVLGQTDHNPKFTFFWYAADGRSQIQLKGSEDVIRAGRSQHGMAQLRVGFAASSVGFAALADGLLAVFDPEKACLVTPDNGLPIPRIEHLAVVSNDLVMAGDGKIAVWRTTEPLTPALSFDERREWSLAGPCVRDPQGNLWAFLLDFPDRLSRHDGRRWRHFDVGLTNRIPTKMSADDKGRLQLGFHGYPGGSSLVTDGVATHWPSAPARAWDESVGTGAACFSDGTPFLWTGAQTPPLSIGRNGIAAGTGPGRLPVVYDGPLKIPLPDPPERPRGSASPRRLALQGNEVFFPAPGGGWVGQYRVFRDAYYPVAGRVYPETNGLYLTSDNTLRFQSDQKLTITGEVVTTGKVQRLVCRIAGTVPAYKPRLLAFLDGEFIDGLAKPDGCNLPALQPGLHDLDVYAADGFGVVAEEPLRLTLDGGPSGDVTFFDLDEAWIQKPHRLQTLPTMAGDRNVVGKFLEIDADGAVWILVDGGVVSLDPARRRGAFYRVPANRLVAARGRVWAVGPGNRDSTRLPLYGFQQDGVRQVADLCSDPWYSGIDWPLGTDPDGGIWAVSQSSAARWDGKRVQRWDRDIGAYAIFLTYPGGIVIHGQKSYFVYRNGELSQAIPWPDDFSQRFIHEGRLVYTLGQNLLVLPTRKAVLDMDSGRVSERKFTFGGTYRMGTNGSLFAWHKRQLSLVSGEGTTTSNFVYSPPPPTQHAYNDPDWNACLATTGGVLAYPAGAEKLFIGRPAEGATEYGWQQGVQPGRTRALREAPDGRVWILRDGQLLVYDSSQPPSTMTPAWPGWREEVPVAQGFLAGAFGNIWYRQANPNRVICTDGTNQTFWALEDTYGEFIVSDQKTAAIFSGNDTYILTPSQKVERVKDRQTAILELINRGANQFEGNAPPVVAADGRVYFRGQLWDGKTWHRVPEGRASRDLRGELFVLCRADGFPPPPPVVYRLDGVNATTLGKAEQCLIDAEGLRWYDPALEEAGLANTPVWYGGNTQTQISCVPGATRSNIENTRQMQAIPLAIGKFLVRVDGTLYLLDARGLSPLPGDRLPCGSGLRGIYRLAEGRWAFADSNRILISPPDYHLVP